eukprot:6652119-Alexandrium_andersonii.AAC.1
MVVALLRDKAAGEPVLDSGATASTKPHPGLRRLRGSPAAVLQQAGGHGGPERSHSLQVRQLRGRGGRRATST